MTELMWERVKEVFASAMALDPNSRISFLEAECGSDVVLKDEVESLIKSHSQAEAFMEDSMLDEVARILSTTENAIPSGHRIGVYQIIREIGRGGMGAVYLASRADDEYQQEVAIKVIKRGMDTDDILRRFRNERQILASLDHSNIARMLDGGTTSDGLPFFVMEYIDGLRLLDYCERHQLGIVERLELFRKVCAAVQHAHQNLVVHCDLKPSNILVRPDGEPKLLDFGVARLLTPEIGPITRSSAVMRVMTRDYASPEQVLGERITTASDVYSLGVILYELLTGCRPYKLLDASPAELLRVICYTEPTRPSAALRERVTELKDLSAGGQGDGLSNETHNSLRFDVSRSLAAKEQIRFKGDLDNIVLMALRKEPSRRYQSAHQLSQDIRRHLIGRPVLARKDTFTYRASKYIHRNRGGVAAAALVAMALVGGFIGILWQAHVATKERDRANLEKFKAQAINEFIQRMLNYANPVVVRSGKADSQATIVEVLDEAAKRLDEGEFSDQPEVKAELERIIGEAYNYQGKYAEARRHYNVFSLLAKNDGVNNIDKLLADIYAAGNMFDNGDMDGADREFRRVLPLLRDGERDGKVRPEVLAAILNDFAYMRRTRGDSKEAEMLFREVLDNESKIPFEQRFLLGLTRSTLASTVADQGRFDEALQISSQALADYRQKGATQRPDYGFALTVHAGFLTDEARFDEANQLLTESEDLLRKTLNPSHLWLGDNLRNHAIVLYRQNRYAEARSKIEEALKIYSAYGKQYDHYPTALWLRGLTLTREGKQREGELLVREALKIRRETLRQGHYFTAQAQGALGECLMIQRRYDEAERELLESYDSLKESLGEQNPRTLLADQLLTTLHKQWRRPEIARQ